MLIEEYKGRMWVENKGGKRRNITTELMLSSRCRKYPLDVLEVGHRLMVMKCDKLRLGAIEASKTKSILRPDWRFSVRNFHNMTVIERVK